MTIADLYNQIVGVFDSHGPDDFQKDARELFSFTKLYKNEDLMKKAGESFTRLLEHAVANENDAEVLELFKRFLWNYTMDASFISISHTKALVDAGADVNWTVIDFRAFINQEEGDEFDNFLELHDHDGGIGVDALVVAVCSQQAEVLKLLLENDELYDIVKNLALLKAYEKACDESLNIEFMKILIKFGADINQEVFYEESGHVLPMLCVAMLKGDSAAVKVLLDSGAETSAVESMKRRYMENYGRWSDLPPRFPLIEKIPPCTLTAYKKHKLKAKGTAIQEVYPNKLIDLVHLVTSTNGTPSDGPYWTIR